MIGYCEVAMAKKIVVKGVVTDTSSIALKDARVVIYTNKYKLLAMGSTDSEGLFLFPVEVIDNNKVLVEIKLKGYYLTEGPICQSQLKPQTGKYQLTSYADTVNLSVRLRMYKPPKRTDGDGIISLAGELLDLYCYPHMHAGIFHWRSNKLYRQKSAYYERLKR